MTNSGEILDPKDRCPFLALNDDPETWYAFPANDNYCHKARSISQIALDYQENTCLAGQNSACPLYQHAGQWRKALPAEIRHHDNRKRLRPLAGLGRIRLPMVGRKTQPSDEAAPDDDQQPEVPAATTADETVDEAAVEILADTQDTPLDPAPDEPDGEDASRARRRPFSTWIIVILVVITVVGLLLVGVAFLGGP